MSAALDSSVLVAALVGSDPDHDACHALLAAGGHAVHAHALTETFSTLTGGRLGFRVAAGEVARMLRDHVAPRLRTVVLDASDLLRAYGEAEARGVRGGAIHDYLHLVAARKAGAERFHTLNLGDFRACHRPGDPEILPP